MSLLLAFACVFAGGSSIASTLQTTFQVTANVNVSCQVSATDLAFGTYEKSNVNPLDGQSNLQVDCTNGTNWNLGLDQGLHATDVLHRAMANNTDSAVQLNYAIYQDPARTLNWGNTVGTDTVSGTGTGVIQSVGAYGRVPAGQTTAKAGGYSDTITATLTF